MSVKDKSTVTDVSPIGYRIHSLRTEKGLSLSELARRVGVGASTVRKWETGYITKVGHDKIALLAEALETTPSEIMGWEQEDTPSASNRQVRTFAKKSARSPVQGTPIEVIPGATIKHDKQICCQIKLPDGSIQYLPIKYLSLSKEDRELLRIYDKLTVRKRMDLLQYAMALNPEDDED